MPFARRLRAWLYYRARRPVPGTEEFVSSLPLSHYSRNHCPEDPDEQPDQTGRAAL